MALSVDASMSVLPPLLEGERTMPRPRDQSVLSFLHCMGVTLREGHIRPPEQRYRERQAAC
jgi:hypothetical protein